jgi:hypothetical protein
MARGRLTGTVAAVQESEYEGESAGGCAVVVVVVVEVGAVVVVVVVESVVGLVVVVVVVVVPPPLANVITWLTWSPPKSPKAIRHLSPAVICAAVGGHGYL